MDRLEVLLYFEKLANRLAKTSLPGSAQEVVITELVLHAENLYPAEISETIYQLMDAGKVDEQMIVKEDIEDAIVRRWKRYCVTPIKTSRVNR